jgi:hypothetical protein
MLVFSSRHGPESVATDCAREQKSGVYIKPMAQRLPELIGIKGRRRASQFYYGDETDGRPETLSYLTDAAVTRSARMLKREGAKHRDEKHEHLIFSNCVANVGKGLLLLDITRSKTNRNRASVKQVIEDDATADRSQWARVPAGRAVFDSNPDHNHWHYADFLRYSLWRVGERSKRAIRRSKKQSFCLEDVAKLRKTARRREFTECPDVTAGSGSMGITPGWGDVYWSGVQEQFLEVKRLKPGDYWLEMEIDPFRRLKVKSLKGHKTRVLVKFVIRRGRLETTAGSG